MSNTTNTSTAGSSSSSSSSSRRDVEEEPQHVVRIQERPTGGARSKKQRTHNSHHDDSDACPIMEFLTDDILVEIFWHVGPRGTAQCARVCRLWRDTCYHSRSLWRHFCQATFSFGLSTNTTNQLVEDGASNNNHAVDWRAVYAYISEQASFTGNVQLLPVQVLFADDGTACPGYPAENAVHRNNGGRAWCTNAGVDQNVDLVVQSQEPCLVQGFVARNGGLNYSAPLKEALVFASYDPIDLEETRRYNNNTNSNNTNNTSRDEGEGAMFEHESNNNSNDNSNEGSRWVDRLEGPEPETVLYEETIRQWMLEIAASEEWAVREPVLEQPVLPPHHDGALPPPHNSPGEVLQPLVAVRMPPLPRAYHARVERPCRPVVARYIQFKLLSSYSSPERLSDNMDVMDLLTFGTRLPQLPNMLHQHQHQSDDGKGRSAATATAADPSYRRMHKERVYPYMDLL